jgi:hypothetical protein
MGDDNMGRQFCVVLAAASLLGNIVAAQDFWQPTNGPFGGFVSAFAIAPEDGDILAGTNGNGVFRSTDNGGSWISIKQGMPNTLCIHLPFINGHFRWNFHGIFRSRIVVIGRRLIPALCAFAIKIQTVTFLLAARRTLQIDGRRRSLDGSKEWRREFSMH